MTSRRGFLSAAPLLGLAGAPAVVGAQPAIRWRLASSFPKALDALYAAAEQVAQQVSAATGGRFQIQVFAANELVPPFGVLDAVREGTVECGHSASYYYIGKDPTFAFDCAMPFGLNSRQQAAWLVDGGFVGHEQVEQASAHTTVYGPVPAAKDKVGSMRCAISSVTGLFR